MIFLIFTLSYFILFNIIFGVYQIDEIQLSFEWIVNNTSFITIIIMFFILILSAIVSLITILFINYIYIITYSKNKEFSKRGYKKVNKLIKLINFFIRLKIRSVGFENVPLDDKLILIGNHQAQLDIVAILTAFKGEKISFISKPEVFDMPYVGRWMKKMKCIPIYNKSDRDAAKAIISGIKNIKAGLPVVIFPEGKRSKSNIMDEFKPGAFKLASKTKGTIIPVTLKNTYISEKKLYKIFRGSVKVDVVFGKPIKYEEYKDMNTIELSEFVKSKIQDNLNDKEMK